MSALDRHSTTRQPKFGSKYSLSAYRSQATSLRFGALSSDKQELTESRLPEWATRIKAPKVLLEAEFLRLALFLGLVDEKERKTWRFKMKLLRAASRFIWRVGVLGVYEFKFASKRLLPADARARVRAYKRSAAYWKLRFSNPAEAKRMCLVHEGPIAIKSKQATVQQIEKNRAEMEAMLKDGISIEGATGFLKVVTDALNFTLRRVAKRQLKELKIYGPLLNSVPILPKELFQKRLDALQKAYNVQHPDDPIVTIREAVKSGSIAQVFPGQTRSGQKVMMKVLRPDIRPEFLDAYRPYLFYKGMMLRGDSPEAKRQALQEAEAQIQLLKEEGDPLREARNTQAMGEQIKQLGIASLKVPEMRVASPDGLVMPYVGENDFIDLSVEEKNRRLPGITPDLCRLALFGEVQALDVHSGNVRSGEPAFLLDHGRSAHLDPAVQKALQTLMVAVYSAPDPAALAEDSAVLQAIAKLLGKAPTPGSEADTLQKALQTLQAGDSKADSSEALSEARKTVDGFLLKVFSGPRDVEDGERLDMLTDAMSGRKQGETLFRDKPSHLFRIWSNYAQAFPNDKTAGFQPITIEPVSRNDLKKSQKEFCNFIHPYFKQEHVQQDRACLLSQLKAMSPESFAQTFGLPGRNAELQAMPAGTFKNNKEDPLKLAHDYTELTRIIEKMAAMPKRDPETETLFQDARKTQAELLAQFENARSTLLASGKKSVMDKLLELYRTSLNCQTQATTLADGLLKRCGKDSALKADPTRRNRLIERMTLGLRQEIGT